MPLRINREPVMFTSTEHFASTYTLELAGRGATNLELTDEAETDPAGRWRLRAAAKKLTLFRSMLAQWADDRWLMTFDTATNSVSVNQQLFVLGGLEVADTLGELITRSQELARQIALIALSLADIGLDLPQELVDVLNDTVLDDPDALLYSPAKSS